MKPSRSFFSKKKKGLHQQEVTIRPYGPGDAGYIAYLHGKLYAEKYQFGPVFEYYVMKGLTEFLYDSEGGELWIAEVNGQIAGSIAITRENENTAQLRWFILDEKFHGAGIGRRLMETAVEFCNEQGYTYVFLWTVSDLKAARYLYKDFNFELKESKQNDEWTESEITEEKWELTIH
ncbi:GNAT family N-acetyltransferase [Evansella clarkii]|uniref:GNAT family N-acetyltransferase n=1 Tax=Evansella clarkii TaxID=79879 RepID=UPI000996D320|nr:GNAT family N-acetyltransferase [Evansella clarkii]